MAHIARLRRYPVKGLDGMEVDSARLSDSGTVVGDREFAMCEPTADRIETGDQMQTLAYNGKQTDRFHDLRTAFDPETGTLTVDTKAGGDRREFDLSTEAGRAAASEWFGTFIDDDVEFRRHEPPAFVDRPHAGPSVISTATLKEVASWFDDMSVESARRRLRANIEVGGVPAFWEDRFVGERTPPGSRTESGNVGEDAPGFVVGDDDPVRFEGYEPCSRCVVPSRDPETGEPLDRFREWFVEKREATFPEWADPEAFDHYYTVMLISQVPEGFRERTVEVGDEVTVPADDG